MNRIYKVIYSKVRQCYVVVSEIAKSHGRHTKSSVAKSNAALTAAVLIALGGISFITNPEVAYADLSASNGYYLGISKADDSRTKDDNANGKGAGGTDSITIGHNSTASTGTITIGDRRADDSKYSVYLGEHYTSANQQYPDPGNYVTSIGYDSDARGKGSIALGSGAEADVNRASEGHEKNPDADNASVAIGYQAKANQNNIAIGAHSVASDAASEMAAAAITGQAAPTSYVSVGDGIKDSATQYRRITNVADGAAASDVATVGQLQELEKKAGVYKAGFGIEITPDTTTKENTIKLSRNLGRDMDSTDNATLVADENKSALVLGGRVEEGQSKGGQVVEKPYGAFGQDSVVVGGANNIADKDGLAAVVVGGTTNTASAQYSTVAGGNNNDAFGNESSVFGGFDNDAFGAHATLSGGSMNRAYGEAASVFGGAMNSALGDSSVAVGGLQSTVNGAFAVGIAGGSTNANHALAAGNGANVTVENGTAIGYQATTDEAKTIAFGHDAGDVSGYTIEWNKLPKGQVNADGTANDYTKAPKSVTPTTYKDAYYNRLVKVADGQDDHDVVVMEQLKQYAEKDASNLGNKIKVYTTDEKGNVQFDKDKNPVEDKDATTNAQNASKDAWGQALGADTFTPGKSDAATDASASDQLVTGKTLYNYDKPTGSTNYVNANNTTGQNLSALDAQVKANADELNKPNRNIKYYSVKTLPLTVDGYTNENNDGAKGMGSLAAGFVTHADGIASTVAGSYSGVINSGNAQGRDLRGAAALSYGTFNVNQNTDATKLHSGVANSIVGQANMTTNSNAAIIYGAGNTVTNSYRPIAEDKASAILKNVFDPTKLGKAMQDAVKESGGQVMVMGGGNTVDKAYMTQVTGVGNTVTGADSTYAEGTSTQYNFVDGFQNELTHGKHDYIVGSDNSVTGDSIDKNQSNIVVGDNHTLKNRKNNVVIGSADKKENKNKELTASDATVIGHNADVTVDGGVAIGSGSVSTATAEADAEGYDPVSTTTNKASTNPSATWKATTGAVSIGGGVNGNTTTTRRITNLAAGFNDTDAVNVAQIKKLASIDASNIGANLKKADGTAADSTDITNNKKAWATAIGTGTITKDDDGSKQLVTGGTVYTETHPTDGNYIKAADSAATNLTTLDTHVKSNADAITKEVADRTAADTVIDNKIGTTADGNYIKAADSVGTNLGTLDTQVKSNADAITKEVSDRTAADTAINTKIGTTADGNYIKAADSVGTNLGTLDTQIKANADAINKGVKDLTDTGLTVSDGTNTGVAKLGSTVAVTGDSKNVSTALTQDANGNTTIKVSMSDNPNFTTVTTTGDTHIGGNLTVDGTTNLKGDTTIEGNTTFKKNVTMEGDTTVKNLKLADGTNLNNAVTYDSNAKDVITLKGADGTTITNLKDGALSDTSKDAVTGKQLYAEQQARDAADTAINTKIGTTTDGNYVKAADSVGTNLGTLDTQVKSNADAITKEVSDRTAADTAINTKIGTTADGNYIKAADSVGTNLGTLDTQVKANADAIGKGVKDLTDKGITMSDGTNTGVAKLGSTVAVTGDSKNVSTALTQDANGNTTLKVSMSDNPNFTTVTTTGDTHIGGNLTVDGTTNLKGDTTIEGDTTFKKNVTMEGDTTVKNLKLEDGTNLNNAVTYDSDAKDAITLKGADGTTITNLKDGALSDTSKDAVTGKQLYAEQQARDAADAAINTKIGTTADGNYVKAADSIGTNLGTLDTQVKTNADAITKEVSDRTAADTAINNKIGTIADGNYVKAADSIGTNLGTLDTQVKATHDLINSDGKTIKIGGSDAATKVDVSGKDGQSRVITGVKTDANDSTSAASVGYVNDMNAANTQQIYHDMNSAYSHVENDISRAAAGSNALAALHPMQEFDPDDKAQFALGYGHYRNSNAGAVGAFYQPDENSLFSFGVSFGNGDAGLNAGVTFKFGPGGSNHHALTKTQMAKVIDAQSKEIDALKKDNADKDKRIDALEQKVNEILAKVEKDKA